MAKKIFSGVQPSGNLHLGNYIGAIKNFVDLQNLEGSVMTINDKLSIKQPSRFAGSDVVRGVSDSGDETNPRGMPTNEEIRRMVEQELEEAYSEKQRRWACAQSGESRKDFKGEPSLSPKEAEEMCKDTKLTKAKKK